MSVDKLKQKFHWVNKKIWILSWLNFKSEIHRESVNKKYEEVNQRNYTANKEYMNHAGFLLYKTNIPHNAYFQNK